MFYISFKIERLSVLNWTGDVRFGDMETMINVWTVVEQVRVASSAVELVIFTAILYWFFTSRFVIFILFLVVFFKKRGQYILYDISYVFVFFINFKINVCKCIFSNIFFKCYLIHAVSINSY